MTSVTTLNSTEVTRLFSNLALEGNRFNHHTMNKNPVETLHATSLHLCAFKLTSCTSIKNEAEPPPLSPVEVT